MVTFDDGVTVRVLDGGTLNIDDFPWFKKVLHVEGFKANLINNSESCDLNLNVNFNLKKFVVLDTDGKSYVQDFCVASVAYELLFVLSYCDCLIKGVRNLRNLM